MAREREPSTNQYWLMLTRLYIDALLVDEELADQVWEDWDADELNNAVASIAWMLIIRQTLSD